MLPHLHTMNINVMQRHFGEIEQWWSSLVWKKSQTNCASSAHWNHWRQWRNEGTQQVQFHKSLQWNLHAKFFLTHY